LRRIAVRGVVDVCGGVVENNKRERSSNFKEHRSDFLKHCYGISVSRIPKLFP
jgi:hypothetical protein